MYNCKTVFSAKNEKAGFIKIKGKIKKEMEKIMKNIFTRALALTIVFALCAVSVFAAPAITRAEYDKVNDALDVVTTGYTAGKSATLLVVKKGANLASLSNTDIVYIDQVDNAAADQTYDNIPIKARATEIGANEVEVYIGGTEVAAAIPYASALEVIPTATPVTYTYEASLPATSYAKVEDAIAALVVKKRGSDNSEATLKAEDYTVTANPTAPAANAQVTLTVAIVADPAATVAPVTFTYKPVIEIDYAVTVAAGEYTSLDAVKAAALTVTKTVKTNGVAAAPVTLAAGEYTAEYADNAGTVTITIKVDGAVVATTTATYTAPVEPPVSGGKTAIAGTVKYKLGTGWRIGEGALVLIINNGTATIAASAVADANGAFEVEVPAGTYTVLVRYSRLAYSNSKLNITNYANTK